MRFYELEDFGGTSPVSLLGLGRRFCQYIPLLLHLTELLAQLAKFLPFVGGEPFRTLSIVSVSFLYPISNGLLSRLKLLGEAGRRSSVSGEFDNSISEFIRVWWTSSRRLFRKGGISGKICY